MIIIKKIIGPTPPALPKVSDARADLMASIRKGKTLKKTSGVSYFFFII